MFVQLCKQQTIMLCSWSLHFSTFLAGYFCYDYLNKQSQNGIHCSNNRNMYLLNNCFIHTICLLLVRNVGKIKYSLLKPCVLMCGDKKIDKYFYLYYTDKSNNNKVLIISNCLERFINIIYMESCYLWGFSN